MTTYLTINLYFLCCSYQTLSPQARVPFPSLFIWKILFQSSNQLRNHLLSEDFPGDLYGNSFTPPLCSRDTLGNLHYIAHHILLQLIVYTSAFPPLHDALALQGQRQCLTHLSSSQYPSECEASDICLIEREGMDKMGEKELKKKENEKNGNYGH